MCFEIFLVELFISFLLKSPVRAFVSAYGFGPDDPAEALYKALSRQGLSSRFWGYWPLLQGMVGFAEEIANASLDPKSWSYEGE